MKQKKFISTSVEETKKVAMHILDDFLYVKKDTALVIGLSGELGAGKTHFVQGVARHVGFKRNITSPTFVVMKKYDLQKEGLNIGEFANFRYLYHFDCYRIGSPEEMVDIGWNGIVSDPGNIVLVEWAERVNNIMPSNAIWVSIISHNKSEREIVVEW